MGLGALGVGKAITFSMYYGVAETEASADAARATVGASLYSYGQQSATPTVGSPWTYTLAFGDEEVGGEILPIDSAVLMLAGIQSSAIWMLPVLAGALGAGAYFVRTRINQE